MPYPIYFEVADEEPDKDEEGNIIISQPEALNDTYPLYLKLPGECTDEDYKEFYKKTFKEFQEPLFWIHLNMDYPFNLKGILYFPKLSTEFESIEGSIKLYNRQVFVADNIKEVIPEFLLLLKGVIDCPDLPLNVSRSFLQNDGFTRKISSYIAKKVADKLKSLFKSDREDFEKFWDDISPFVKYGVIKDEKFYKKVESILLYKTTDDKHVTSEEYIEKYGKDDQKQIYYVSDPIQQGQYIKMLKEHDVEAVILDHGIDTAFISHIEMKAEGVTFKRVDSHISEIIKDLDDNVDEEASKEETETLTKVFNNVLNIEDCKIQLESLKSEDIAGMIILSEDSRRMQEMMKRYSAGGLTPGMIPNEEVLVLNKKHQLIQYLLGHSNDESELRNMIVQQVYDLAILSHKQLSPEAMTKFIKRTNEIMKKMIV